MCPLACATPWQLADQIAFVCNAVVGVPHLAPPAGEIPLAPTDSEEAGGSGLAEAVLAASTAGEALLRAYNGSALALVGLG